MSRRDRPAAARRPRSGPRPPYRNGTSRSRQRCVQGCGAPDSLELAQTAYSSYVAKNPREQARLVKTLVSNSTFDGGSLSPTYIKPFDVLASGGKTGDWLLNLDSNQEPAGSQAEQSLNSRPRQVWRLRRADVVEPRSARPSSTCGHRRSLLRTWSCSRFRNRKSPTSCCWRRGRHRPALRSAGR